MCSFDVPSDDLILRDENGVPLTLEDQPETIVYYDITIGEALDILKDESTAEWWFTETDEPEGHWL